MRNCIASITAIVIVIILYLSVAYVSLISLYVAVLSFIGLVTDFNLKDLYLLIMFLIFFYWIFKTK